MGRRAGYDFAVSRAKNIHASKALTIIRPDQSDELNALNERVFPEMKVKELIELIEKDGWFLNRTKGSHRQFKHPIKNGLVTVAGKQNDDIAPGTLNNILKQAGLKK